MVWPNRLVTASRMMAEGMREGWNADAERLTPDAKVKGRRSKAEGLRPADELYLTRMLPMTRRSRAGTSVMTRLRRRCSSPGNCVSSLAVAMNSSVVADDA